MPPVIRGSWSDEITTRTRQFYSQNFDYTYPYELNLKPGTPVHDRIVSKIMEQSEDAYNVISKRHATWNLMDEILTAYIPLSEYEAKLKKEDRTRPVSIVVPHSYATLETVLSYNTKAFLNADMFQYEGHGPEDTVPAKLLELVVAQQTHRFKTSLDVHTGFRDGLAYGFHASVVRWNQQWGKKPTIQETEQFSSMGASLGMKREKVNVPALLFEGNRVTAIDPYNVLPDPNVSIHRIQDGESFGWFEFTSLFRLLEEELSGGDIFNVKYLEQTVKRTPTTSIFSRDKSKREKEGTSKDQTNTTKYVPVVTRYRTIVPADWGLPGDPSYNKDGKYPEKWTFMIGNDTILLWCDRLGLNHDRFPVAVNSPDYDGYSCAPVSRMEINYGLQEVLNWVFNSHIQNVRKAINDMFVVDPSLISMTDLQNPEPGKLLRLRRSAWGRGVDQAIKQLQVTDITKNNLTDAGFVMDMMQKAWATPDAGMGFMRGGGERRSAAEFSGTFGAHISRLEHMAKITSLQYMYDLGYLHASHTQQLMSEEVYVKAIGDWPQVLVQEFGIDKFKSGRYKVDPFSIIADFDVIVKDASDAHIDSGAVQFWTTMLPVLMGNPALFKVFDITRIFKHVARMTGAKNVNDFVVEGGDVKAKVLADETVMNEKDKGNLVPVGGE